MWSSKITTTIRTTALSAAVVFSSLSAFAQTAQFGRYVGTLKHNRLGKEQLAKLDFVVSRNQGNEIDLKAVLTLHFGDFRSGEYISYHFDKVNYNLITGALSFDSAEEDATIVTSRFANGELVANLRSASGGQVGELSLKLNGTATPSVGLIEPLNGEYVGLCKEGDKEENKVLQIHTLRSTGDSSRVGSPFAANEIRGQIGVINDFMCGDSHRTRACNRDNFNQGAYNFYKGELELIGQLTNLDCKVDGNTLKCGNSCTLTRRSNEVQSRIFAPPQATPVFLKDEALANSTTESKAIAGLYRGYVHNEFLDTYQPIEIDVATYQSTDGGESNLKVSAVATLYFGGVDDNESISYRFEPRDYPNPILRPQFVLSRLEDDVDAFLKVTSLGNGTIKGEWFSLLFGRVGAFEASKDGSIKIAPNAKSLKPIGANYKFDDFKLSLKIFQGTAPPNTENPFYPLQIGGNMWFTGTAKTSISGGSYDFYTGRLSVLYGDDRLFSSKRTDTGDLNALMTSNGFGTIMPIYEAPRVFKTLE